MTTQMFGVRITEETQTLRQALSSPTSIGVMGTLTGHKAHTSLDDGAVVHFTSAAAAIRTLTPETGTPTGTLWGALADIRSRTRGEVMLLKIDNLKQPVGSDTSALQDNVGKFSDLSDFVDDGGQVAVHEPPTYLVAPDATVNRADEDDLTSAFLTTASANLSALEAEAELIEAKVIATAPAIGADRATRLMNAIAYARANRHDRVLLVDRGIGTTWSDASVAAAASLMNRDHEVGIGAYPVTGTEVNGVSSVYPHYTFSLGGNLYASSDGKQLQEDNLVQLVRISGYELWGNKFNVGTASQGHTPTPADYFHARSTADTLETIFLSQAASFFRNFVDGLALNSFRNRMQAQVDDIIGIGGLVSGSVTLDEDATVGTRAVYDVRLRYPLPGEYLGVNIVHEAVTI